MKLLIYILAIFFIAVVAGLLAQQDPGYVLIGRGYQTIEVRLSLFVTLQILLFAALYFAIRFISQTWGMKQKIHSWRQDSRSKKARDSLRRGLIELAQGRWKFLGTHDELGNTNRPRTDIINHCLVAKPLLE